MNDAAFVTISLAVVGQAVAVGYFAATLRTTVKYLKTMVEDHENRLRGLET